MRPIATFRPPPVFDSLSKGSSVQSTSIGGPIDRVQKSGRELGGSQVFSLLDPAASNPGQADKSFSDMGSFLVDQVKGVNAMQTGADSMVHSMLTGGDVNEAEVLTAVQKADLAFRMLMQIRNKLMDAYREIQQVQI